MTAPVLWLVVGGICVVMVILSALARANAAAGFFIVAAVFAFGTSVITSALLAVAG